MIMEYIQNHHAEFWMILGFTLLAIEIATGLVTGVFLFVGLGMLITGLMQLAGLVPETWLWGIAITGLSSGIITALLWKPMKNLQRKGDAPKDNSSDFVGLEFVIEQDITTINPGVKRYSGINWQVEIDPAAPVSQLAAGSRVKVSSVDAGVFRVVPLTVTAKDPESSSGAAA